MTDVDLTGRTLANRYDILELLGTGGMGAVYRARDRELDELVALKVIRNELANDPEILDRFRSEVKLARRVTHANVARTFELGHADDVIFCTMELVVGESLTARLRTRRKLPIGESVAIACALCDGLAAAHAADVIHRDIKPDNVLIAADGRVVMADFGVAAFGITERRDLSGTPAYMAPEQARGEQPTPAADVYAVGVLLFEMITGRRAFGGDVTKILADKQAVERLAITPGDVPTELAEVIARATERDLGARFSTATQLRRALAPWDRPGRATTHPHRLVVDASELPNIVVLAPRGEASPLLYLAEAVQDEIVARFGRIPRTRVLPRARPIDEPGAFVIALDVTDLLEVRISRDGAEIARFQLPLSIELVDDTAEAMVRATMGVIATVTVERTFDSNHEALDLMFRARHLALRDFRRVEEAMGMLAQARDKAPGNPKIAAMLAIAQVRLAFFSGGAMLHVVEGARALATQAIVAAPHESLGHMALGHVELNVGDPIVAARHFRVAIACAPHSPEAHEQLGRMLLDTGYLEPAIARLQEAIAINPNLRSAMWEIARAWALEGRWDDHDRVVAEMIAEGVDRAVARARYAWWRRDKDKLRVLRDTFKDAQNIFVPGMMPEFLGVFLDDQWESRREGLVRMAYELPPMRRRRAFVGQLIVEAAAYSNDVPTALAMIEFAITDGLFDLHWLDKCPLLDNVRADPALAPLRAVIKKRADGILDALYGDHHMATSETAVASAVF